MKNTQFKVEEVFGDVLNEDSDSLEQTTNPINFLTKKI